MASLTGGIIGHQEGVGELRMLVEKELTGLTAAHCSAAGLSLSSSSRVFLLESAKLLSVSSRSRSVQNSKLACKVQLQICYFSLGMAPLITRLVMERPFVAVPLFIDLKRQLLLTGKYFTRIPISTFSLFFFSLSFFTFPSLICPSLRQPFIYFFVDLVASLCLLFSLFPFFVSLVCVYVCVSAHYIFIHWP